MPLLLALIPMALGVQAPAADLDPRNIQSGLVIPDEGYCDQPYVVVLPDGDWMCVMTTGPSHEGQAGQHVVSLRSSDQGRSWSDPVDIEPAEGPEASWAMPLLAPDGRVHVFYVYNGDRVGGRRADMIGWYCWRFSDDGGRSWSERRRLPLRETAVDRGNDFGGDPQIFWGIGKPIVFGGTAIFGLTKIGRYMLDDSEGWFFRSRNLLREHDPDRVVWELLPEGDHGLRAPEHGSIQSEQNLVALANGDLYCMYRTTMGYPCHAYSRDGGASWTKPEAATYSPGGRRFKHPRACPRIWRTKEGRYLFWFHNMSAKDWSPGTRNPAWISGGIERQGTIHWSQPELLLYDPDPNVRISYPDLIEQDGRIWITETQKSIARVHEVDPSLLEGLWTQGARAEVPREGLVLEASTGEDEVQSLPELPDLNSGGSFSIEFWLRRSATAEETTVLSAVQEGSAGLHVSVLEDGSVALVAFDGLRLEQYGSDPGLLSQGDLHHVVAIADGGPGILTWVVDGALCDGGEEQQAGWTRLRAPGDQHCFLATAALLARDQPIEMDASVEGLRIYDRALRTSEAIASFHAGR